MAKQHKSYGNLISIMGGILVALGLHILLGHMSLEAAQLRHLLGIPAGETLGLLPSVLAASQAAQAYGLDRPGFLEGLFELLISLWPLFIVIAGTALLRDFFTDNGKARTASNKYFQEKNNGCRFPCPSFDV
jgi:hypothetical protein